MALIIRIESRLKIKFYCFFIKYNENYVDDGKEDDEDENKKCQRFYKKFVEEDTDFHVYLLKAYFNLDKKPYKSDLKLIQELAIFIEEIEKQ